MLCRAILQRVEQFSLILETGALEGQRRDSGFGRILVIARGDRIAIHLLFFLQLLHVIKNHQ
jgi:hypothetical protein